MKLATSRNRQKTISKDRSARAMFALALVLMNLLCPYCKGSLQKPNGIIGLLDVYVACSHCCLLFRKIEAGMFQDKSVEEALKIMRESEYNRTKAAYERGRYV
jgi:hypothetical protein